MQYYLMGIDIGTSSCKVALFDASGAVKAQASAAYAVSYPHPGWAEQAPQDWWHGVCAASRQMIESSGVLPGQIAGIGVDGQSWSAVMLDKDGNVLCKTPIWTDTRSAEITKALEDQSSALFDLCGNPLQPAYTLPKLLWFQKHQPEIYQNTDKVLQSNSYIVYRMTGCVTQDLSQGYGFACFDMRRGCWDKNACKALGLSPTLLPDIFPCHQVVGRLTPDAALEMGLLAGIPVVAGGLDAACGALGAGVLHAGETQEQGGQAGGMSLCLDEYSADPRLILGFHVVPDRWLLQGGTTGGGGALKWLRETMCPELSFAQMSEEAARVPAGSEGVVFLPYMAGERSPIWNKNASGVFFGLNYAKTRAHLIRACMEGVAYSLRHNLEIARHAGGTVGELRAMGGSANSEVWTQIKADITNCRILVPGSDTATSLGAAMLAGVGTGMFSSFDAAVQQTVAIRRTHAPSSAHQDVYEKGYATYRELYLRLHDLMR